MSPSAPRRPRRTVLAAGSAVATLAVVAMVAVLAASRGEAAKPTPCRMTLIPAYVPPAGLLELAARSDRPRMVVMNPASGPGASRSPGYERAVRALQEAGTRVLGYVPTAYGDRDPAAVREDVTRYAHWYGVDGIFLDEVAHSRAHLPYYTAVSAAVRASGSPLVALNPGLVPSRGYFGIADLVVTYEGPYGDYAAALSRAPAWLAEVPAGKIAHLVYGASEAQARTVATLRGGAAYVYATDGVAPDPWSALPAHLDDHEAQLARCPA
jgi:spherulation-specific family 4 protein